MKSKIKTVEQAFKYLQLNPADLPDVSTVSGKHAKAIVAGYQLFIVAEALNKEANDGKEWQPDWNDESKYKYTAYFQVKATKKNPAGVGFSGTCYDVWLTYTFAGSRLCFLSSDLALYAGKQFEKLYKDYLLM